MTQGGFAGLHRVNHKWVFAIPDELPSAGTAPLLCAGITTYKPVAKYVKTGSKVAVIGCGGLGHMAIQVFFL
jgi:uncharacterized zinc-type alcohol dehydrogenase-like protein